MEVAEYRRRVITLARDKRLSDEEFWAAESDLAAEVLDVRVHRAANGLYPGTGEPRPRDPELDPDKGFRVEIATVVITGVKTACGHVLPITNPQAAEEIEARRTFTFDCEEEDCGTTCIMTYSPDGVYAYGRSLHQYLHDQDPAWPADGEDTGFVEFTAGSAPVVVSEEEPT